MKFIKLIVIMETAHIFSLQKWMLMETVLQPRLF